MNNEEKIIGLLQQVLAGFERLEKKVDGLEADIAVLKADVAILKSDVANLKEDVATLNTRMGRLEGIVTRMEADHSKKLAALFDSYSLLYEITVEIRKDNAEISLQAARHDVELKWLLSERQKAIHLDKELIARTRDLRTLL